MKKDSNDKSSKEDIKNLNLDSDKSHVGSTSTDHLINSFDKNRNKIIGFFVILFIIFCSFLIFKQIRENSYTKSSNAYSEALSKNDINSLDYVINNFPKSIASGNALLSKSNIQISEGKYKDAESTLNKFIDNYSNHPSYLRANFMLGSLNYKLDKHKEAKDYYNKILYSDKSNELLPLVKIRLGDLALHEGKKDEAKIFYEESLNDFPDSKFKDYSQLKIDLLNLPIASVIAKPKDTKSKKDYDKPLKSSKDSIDLKVPIKTKITLPDLKIPNTK